MSVGHTKLKSLRRGNFIVRFTWRLQGEKSPAVSYEVNVLEGGDELECECEPFAHMGLLCSYVLRYGHFAVGHICAQPMVN